MVYQKNKYEKLIATGIIVFLITLLVRTTILQKILEEVNVLVTNVISTILAIFTIGLIPGLIVFWLVSNANHRAKSAQDYEAAKEVLRQAPTNVTLREAALNAGRRYYGSLRDGGLPTIYDEQAIANDLAMIIGSWYR